MTEEEKQLLLIDLCGRLPYKPHIYIKDGKVDADIVMNAAYIHDWMTLQSCQNMAIKPYLRPLSSMTEEEKNELRKLCDEDLSEYAKFIRDGHGLSHDGLYMFYPLRQLNFINSHHFDFRGLIQNGLALEAPEDMYKTE